MASIREIYWGSDSQLIHDKMLEAAEETMTDTEKVIEDTAAAVNAAQFAYVRSLKKRILELEAENAALRACSSSVRMSDEAFSESGDIDQA